MGGAGAKLLGVRMQQMSADLLTPCPARGKLFPFSFGVTHPEVKCCLQVGEKRARAGDEGNIIHFTNCVYEKWRNEESIRTNSLVK